MFKLKTEAFTLFESVIAITIITVCLGIGTIIYSNVIHSEKLLVSLEGQFEIVKLFHDTKTRKLFFPKEYDYNAYQIIQRVTDYNGIKQLYHITFDVMVGKHKTYTKQFLVYDSGN